MNIYIVKVGDYFVSMEHSTRFNISFTDDIDKAKKYHDEPQTKIVNKGKNGFYQHEYEIIDYSTLNTAMELARKLDGKVLKVEKVETITELVYSKED